MEKAQLREEAQMEAAKWQVMNSDKNFDETANVPALKTGMIPVKWDGSSWVKADENNTNNDWYSYDTTSKKWANVVTVTSTNRQTYIDAEPGEPIPMSEITTMFVWIPRFAYKIDDASYHQKVNGNGNIEIKWLVNNYDITTEGEYTVEYNVETTENYTKFPNGYVTHPAFKANTDLGGTGREITGFWVGKFESSNSNAVVDNVGYTNSTSATTLRGGGNTASGNVTIKPSVTSWRYINVDNIYTVCKNMNWNNNIHGLTTDVKTTMMQNSQWGAVAYLAQSDYGNKQTSDASSGIWNNPYTEGLTYTSSNDYGMDNYCTTLTGMAGESRDINVNRYSKIVGTRTINDNGSITITYVNINNDKSEGSQFTRTFYHYDSDNGQKASTTRNIYGIYDMSGGSWEYMASYLKNGTTSYVTSFSAKSSDEQTQYEGTGETSSTADKTTNYNANKHMYGDAVWETSNGANGQNSWNGDYSNFPYLTYPFFLRGGTFSHAGVAGPFYFSCSTGGYIGNSGFRAVAL